MDGAQWLVTFNLRRWCYMSQPEKTSGRRFGLSSVPNHVRMVETRSSSSATSDLILDKDDDVESQPLPDVYLITQTRKVTIRATSAAEARNIGEDAFKGKLSPFAIQPGMSISNIESVIKVEKVR